MSQNSSCIEKETLVDYLYGGGDAAGRRRVDAHLRSCASCAEEIHSLADVRRTIEAWEPPDAGLGFRVVADASGPAPARSRRRPAWALAAAAVLAVAAAALIVRPEIELRSDERVLRIGWRGGATEGVAEAGSSASPSDLEAAAGSAMDPLEPTVRGTPRGSAGRGRRRRLRSPGRAEPGTGDGGRGVVAANPRADSRRCRGPSGDPRGHAPGLGATMKMSGARTKA